ncbi:MAG: hypothetical protein U0165_15315 [Polyangiaceae bacterium]
MAISVPLFLVVAAGCTSPDRAFGDGSSGASSGASGSSGSGGSAGSSGSAGSAGSGGSAGSSGSAGSGGTGGSGGASGSSGSAGSGGTGGSSGSAGSSGSGGTGAVSGSAGSGGGTLAIGEVCGNSGDCAQGNCVDGVCCDSACTGSCESCIQIHTGVANGMCAPAIPGAPPHPGCNDEGASSCGHNGVCDGAGNCDFYPVGTTCGAQSCSGGQVTPPPTCDGGGSCVPSSPITCSPNPVCAGNACQGACTGDGDCNGTQYCDLSAGGTCKSKLPNGTSCSTAAANQCSSGLCVDGVCCGSACDTACKTCRAPGSEGSCVALTSADDASPSGICAGSFTCDGSGICRKKNGETCGGSSDCVSGFCVDGVCCNAACTDACRTCAGSGSLGFAPRSRTPKTTCRRASARARIRATEEAPAARPTGKSAAQAESVSLATASMVSAATPRAGQTATRATSRVQSALALRWLQGSPMVHVYRPAHAVARVTASNPRARHARAQVNARQVSASMASAATQRARVCVGLAQVPTRLVQPTVFAMSSTV